MHVTFTPGFDVAQLVFYTFVLFFIGLVFYLRREDRREGYPLEADAAKKPRNRGFEMMAPDRTFLLADGGKLVVRPRRDPGRSAQPRVAQELPPAVRPGRRYHPDGGGA